VYPANGAVKKKTIDEAVSSLWFFPVFNTIAGTPSSTSVSVSSPISIPDKDISVPSQGTEKTKEPQYSPVSRTTDAERRSRRQHSENLATPSISGMLKGTGLSPVSEPNVQMPKAKVTSPEEPFNLSQLLIAWKDFADTVDAAQLKSALSVREPILLDDFCIEYNLDNEVQRKRIIMDVKSKLLAYLHKILKNEHITIEFNVSENLEEIMNKPYTDQEKFNSMAAKYPALSLMKSKFGLDFE
jgi:DNA polymerase-3 subunit gamma/tau